MRFIFRNIDHLKTCGDGGRGTDRGGNRAILRIGQLYSVGDSLLGYAVTAHDMVQMEG